MRELGTAQAVLRAGATLAEGPRWDAARERLLWVDIEEGELHLLDPAGGEDRALALGAKAGCAAPMRSGDVLVALADRLVAVAPATGAVRDLAPLPDAASGLRANDGACDPAGRFLVGTMAEDETPGAGALHRYTGGDRLETLLDGVTLSNGLAWSPDGARMFYVDSPTQRVDVVDYDVATGRLGGRRPFAEIEPEDGTPDGLAVDDEGGVWVALWGGRAVRRYSPDGAADTVVATGADHTTACCFAGTRLFITTARRGLSESQLTAQPDAGAVLAIDVAVSGPAATPFAG